MERATREEVRGEEAGKAVAGPPDQEEEELLGSVEASAAAAVTRVEKAWPASRYIRARRPL